MSISLQTNLNALVAQQNLSVNGRFQSKTIEQLTSGYRINQSGDDAAGLAVANRFRSNSTELMQGVRNGNDAVAQLQIMDGGINNIALILDRLKTLATQSSSTTFTGDRNVLNNEFSTDVAELDRQAQAIGLNVGGTFARSLGVYLGGGAGLTSASAQVNSQVTIDLSNSQVDSQSLNLRGVQTGLTTYDLSTNHITGIIAGNGALATTVFKFYGPGFGAGVDVSVTTAGITDSTALVTAINAGITAAGVSNTAFATAGITASVGKDATSGNQVLSFTSASSAFQVRAGDVMANALLGNTTGATTTVGSPLTSTLTGTAYQASFAAADALSITIEGAGLSAPITLSVTATVGVVAGTTASIIAALAGNATLAAAGITAADSGTTLNFLSSQGGSLKVSVAGDVANVLGYGSFVGAEATSFTGAIALGVPVAGNAFLDLSVNGNTVSTLTVALAATDTTAALQATKINAAIAALGSGSAFAKAGIIAQSSGGVNIASNNGTLFRLGTRNDGTNLSNFGFYTNGSARNTGGLATAYTAVATPTANFVNQNAKGEYQLGTSGTAAPLTFSGISFGTDTQTLTLSAADATGASHSVVATLNQSNAKDIDQAIFTINTAIQATTDTTLKAINAVKVNVAGVEKIEFVSTVQNFSVNVGTTANGTGVGSQGTTLASTQVGTGGTADISTAAGALTAVTAINTAVSLLGAAQAAIGKGQNQMTYAISLASSQIVNFQSAESQIRDTDVAQQAANLTKAQVLQQASIAAMAQANSAPQAVLALLRG